jgi:hypothetical protein
MHLFDWLLCYLTKVSHEKLEKSTFMSRALKKINKISLIEISLD